MATVIGMVGGSHDMAMMKPNDDLKTTDDRWNKLIFCWLCHWSDEYLVERVLTAGEVWPNNEQADWWFMVSCIVKMTPEIDNRSSVYYSFSLMTDTILILMMEGVMVSSALTQIVQSDDMILMMI